MYVYVYIYIYTLPRCWLDVVYLLAAVYGMAPWQHGHATRDSAESSQAATAAAQVTYDARLACDGRAWINEDGLNIVYDGISEEENGWNFKIEDDA